MQRREDAKKNKRNHGEHGEKHDSRKKAQRSQKEYTDSQGEHPQDVRFCAEYVSVLG
jgi:hypothetical protein